MEKHFGSGYDQHRLSSTLNLSGFPFANGYLNTEPVHRYPYPAEDSPSRNLPPVPGSGFQQSKASEPNWLQNWFYHKQHIHHASIPGLNSAPEQKFPAGLSEAERLRNPNPAQKRFLVFDQSGNKTTLLYSSGAHAPVQFGAGAAPNPPAAYNSGSYYPLSLNDENFEKDATEDEMHEDTEELDALLCSDDDDSDFSEDEETSTGHSPSTMTDNCVPKLVEETGEEVDSFSVPTKRRKLSETFASSELESDAESSCGSRKEESYPPAGCKRSRRDKLHETVSILQSIIPDSDGKDAMVVIDQAIHYLRALKVKAKALGLDSA